MFKNEIDEISKKNLEEKLYPVKNIKNINNINNKSNRKNILSNDLKKKDIFLEEYFLYVT